MKKILGIGLIALAFVACKPTNDVKSQIELKGEWTLMDVSYPKGLKVTSFHIADAKCFQGSQWKFVPNNNTGVVNLDATGDCPTFSSNIVWTIGTDQSCNLKFVGSEKAKHITAGYKLNVANQTGNTFDLVDDSTGTKIVYKFVKNQK